MIQSQSRFSRVPIVALLCLLLLVAYCYLTTGRQGLTCQRDGSGGVQCEAVSTFFYGLLPGAASPFTVESVAVTSDLTDRTPRGGVRFCHRLTFSSAAATFTAEIAQSPLAGTAIQRQVQEFLAGNGPDRLTFASARRRFVWVRTMLMAFLLGVVSWSFWDVRWPAARPGSALDLSSESLSQDG